MTKDETMSWVEEISVAGQPAFCLRNAVGDQVVVLQHGAQILSWMTADGVERLYCTSRLPSEPKPVRGGVPVIFPQFNQRGPDFTLPRHGFARQLRWYRIAPNVAAQAAPAPTPFPGMPGAEPGAVAASAPAPAGCGLPETHVPADMTATEAVPGLHAADLVPKKATGSATGLTGLLGYLIGSSFAGVVMGAVVDHLGWDGGFYTLIIACILAIVLLFMSMMGGKPSHQAHG